MLKSILTALVLSADFETGYVPHNVSLLQYSAKEYTYTCYNEIFYATLSPRVQWKFLYFDFDLSYFALPTKGDINFTPFRGVWGGEYGVTYTHNKITVSAGYANNCSHKIIPQIFKTKDSTEYIDNAYNKFFVRVSWSNN